MSECVYIQRFWSPEENARVAEIVNFPCLTIRLALSLQVARLEAETALVALQSLAQLSHELRVECTADGTCRADVTDDVIPAQTAKLPATNGKASDSAGGEAQQLEQLKEQLNERDAALELAKGAMDSLTRLTKQLVRDAEIDFGGGMEAVGA
jgi:hypothetical protein